MKEIVETLKRNRKDLICKYAKLDNELNVIKEGIKQARRMHATEVEDKLFAKRSDLTSEQKNILLAVNDLTNALNHLGESTEVFWG